MRHTFSTGGGENRKHKTITMKPLEDCQGKMAVVFFEILFCKYIEFQLSLEFFFFFHYYDITIIISMTAH